MKSVYSRLQKLGRYESLVAVVALGVFLVISLASIGRFSTWHDESYSATLIENSYGNLIERTGYDVHPPFYYIVLKAWSVVAGDSVMALRLFSLVAMLLAIVIAWRLFRRIYGKRIGLFALLGMSVGPFLIRYSQEMRMYAFGALLAASATWLLWRLLIEPPIKEKRWRFGVGYTSVMTAALFTHYFLSFLLIAHVIFALLTSNRDLSGRWRLQRLWRLIKRIPNELKVGFVLPVILFLPWLPTVHRQFTEVQGAFWISPLKVETFSSTIINFLTFFQQWELVSWTALYGVLVLTAVTVLVIKWYRGTRASEARLGAQLIACLLLIPVGLLVLASVPPFQPAYQDRYLAFYAPFLYGAVALAIAGAWQKGRGYIWKSIGAFTALALLISIVSVSTNGNNQGWRPAPYFTMNTLADHIRDIDPDAQIVSTSLWTYLDAHITFRDTTTRLYAPNGVGKYGNNSVVYGHDELQIADLNQVSGHVWLLEESSKPRQEVPASWQMLDIFESGYGRITLYTAL